VCNIDCQDCDGHASAWDDMHVNLIIEIVMDVTLLGMMSV
jgi:hypothetical protein